MTTTEIGAAPPRLDHVFLDEETQPHLGEIVIERGWLFPQDIARALAAEHGLDYVDIAYSSVDGGAAAALDPEIGKRHCAIPIRFLSEGRLLVAVADPTSAGLEEIRAAIRAPVVFAVADAADIKTAWYALLRGYRP